MITKTNGTTQDTQRLDIYRSHPVFEIFNSEAHSKTDYKNPNAYLIYNDSPKIELLFNEIEVKGSRKGGMWCKCYSNEYINFSVNGVKQSHQGQERSGVQYKVFKP